MRSYPRWLLAGMLGALACSVATPAFAQIDAPDGASISRDVDYMPGERYSNDWDRLDVFMPADAQDAPVIVFFHGGALRAGDKSQGEHLAARLVPHGIGVVTANYRLTPDVMHPAHVQDAAAAFAWVAENIEEYGGDPDEVYIAGHSAGAYLAALLAIDPSHLRAHGLRADSFRGTIPISAFFYVEETARDRPKDVWGEDPAAWLEASVTPHIGPNGGPMLLIYADGDDPWRREQHERFGHELSSAGNQHVQVIEVPNRNHGSLMTEMNSADDQIGDAVLRFINAQS